MGSWDYVRLFDETHWAATSERPIYLLEEFHQ